MSHRIYRRHEIGLPASRASKASLRPASTDHYTTGEELGRPDTFAWWRDIFDYHTRKLGWDDIGYHFGYDRYGRILEGRPLDRRGAHAGTSDGNLRVGVVFLGDDDPNYQDVTDEARSARAHIDMHLLRHFDRGLDYDGHRDHKATGCPGDEIYTEIIPALRNGTLEPPTTRVLRQAVIGVSQTDLDQGSTLTGPYRWALVQANSDGRQRLVWGVGDVGEDVQVEHAVAVGQAAGLPADRTGWKTAVRIGGRDRFETGANLLRTVLAHPPGTENRQGRPW